MGPEEVPVRGVAGGAGEAEAGEDREDVVEVAGVGVAGGDPVDGAAARPQSPLRVGSVGGQVGLQSHRNVAAQ